MQLKFKDTLPFRLQARLVSKYGFEFSARVYGDSITYRKRPKASHPLASPFQLSLAEEALLMKKCDRVVDFFPDPYSSTRAVRTRLHNMSQSLPHAERLFVEQYMEDNFPERKAG